MCVCQKTHTHTHHKAVVYTVGLNWSPDIRHKMDTARSTRQQSLSGYDVMKEAEYYGATGRKTNIGKV